MDAKTIYEKAQRHERINFTVRMRHFEACETCQQADINDTRRFCPKGWQLNQVVELARVRLDVARSAFEMTQSPATYRVPEIIKAELAAPDAEAQPKDPDEGVLRTADVVVSITKGKRTRRSAPRPRRRK